VNNVYIFPGLSFGAQACAASKIPDEIFLAAAEAVAQTLDSQDLAEDRVVPNLARIRDVGLNVAAATAWACQKAGLATINLGASQEEVKAKLSSMMWVPGGGSRRSA